MKPRTWFRGMVVAGIGLVGCNALIDVKDVYFDPNAAVPGGEAGADGAGGEGGTSAEGGVDSGPCMADLQTDRKHCGRCNHDCVGGACTAGKCDPVLLAAGLGGPSAIAAGKDEIYVTGYRANVVLAVAKDGTGTRVLVTEEEQARGVAVVGSTLYWANGYFKYNGVDPDRKGGVWQCTLPACAPATRRLVAAGDWANFPIPRGNVMYFNEYNDGAVVRAPIDGGATTLIAATNKPFGIAVDDVHVYYTSNQPSLYRAKLDGTSADAGTEEIVGPSAFNGLVGFVAVDDLRVYWAYAEETGKGRVLSVAKAAPLAGSVSYGTEADNVFPIGVVLDDKNIYWSTCGSGTAASPTGDGKVMTCPKAGCGATPPVVLANGSLCGGQMAIDDVAIYWAEYGSITQASGRVRKVAKP